MSFRDRGPADPVRVPLNRRPCLVVQTSDGHQFLVEYDAERLELLIDHVRVSTDLMEMFVVAPSERWLRFTRSGDQVTVEERQEDPQK